MGFFMRKILQIEDITMNSAVINPNNAIPSIHTPRPKLFTAKRVYAIVRVVIEQEIQASTNSATPFFATHSHQIDHNDHKDY